MAIPEPEDGVEQDIEAMAKSRRWFREQARKAVISGRGVSGAISGALFSIDGLASPFFLGMDYDADESDFEDMEAY